MALVESTKKGGRYTKKEQEERRLQVYQLHFEENKSALEISETLGVNRNTINEDVKFCFSKLGDNSKGRGIKEKMIEQILRIEIQRERFLEYLEEAETLDEKIRLEKQISEIDNRLTKFYSNAIFSNEGMLVSPKQPKIEEQEIEEFVKDLILSEKNSKSGNVYPDNSIKFEFIKKRKCSAIHAERIIRKMQYLGLNLCEDVDNNFIYKYDLKKFANLRGYLSNEEIEKTK